MILLRSVYERPAQRNSPDSGYCSDNNYLEDRMSDKQFERLMSILRSIDWSLIIIGFSIMVNTCVRSIP